MNEKLRLLAPVPCVHLKSALELRGPRIAFGSNLPNAFKGMQAGLPVLIYASRPHAGEGQLHVKAKATFAATFIKWSKPNTEGMHVHPDERPMTALDSDTAFKGYWVVENFRQLQKSEWVSFADVKLVGKNDAFKASHVRGPTKIEV